MHGSPWAQVEDCDLNLFVSSTEQSVFHQSFWCDLPFQETTERDKVVETTMFNKPKQVTDWLGQ